MLTYMLIVWYPASCVTPVSGREGLAVASCDFPVPVSLLNAETSNRDQGEARVPPKLTDSPRASRRALVPLQ
ncbi:hypothetical protein M8818_001937 [Zalaria obscura]|uniref:Uncharacterized protein n=1 Tax=Zalaria obscura TaxID=2024903 RepID=A0ACC3SN17_9PEZI